MQPSNTTTVVATVSPATTAPAVTVAAKPVKRVLASAKPATAKPLAKPVAVAKPAKPEAAKPSGNVTRTASTIAAGACNFGNLSDRDSAYLTFYAGLAGGKPVTLRAIVDSGKRPAYNGSNKPHDAGVIQRLAKAGLVSPSSDGASFSFTKRAATHAAYAAGIKA